MDSQLNELSKGERTSVNLNRYNLRSKKKEGKPDISNQHTILENPAKGVETSSKEKEGKNPRQWLRALPQNLSRF
jgi:hypothetical protein